MADNGSSSSVAAVAIVILVLVGLFGFFLIYRGTGHQDKGIDVHVENPLPHKGAL